MENLTDDLWTIVLARLPIKTFTCFKLVCKQWKSIVESPFFRNLFMSVHQNSASCSWSLMSRSDVVDPELVGHYQCDTWGLKRPLGYFFNSFLTDMNQNNRYHVSIKAYSDVGLILIETKSTFTEKRVLYVANPVSRECVEIFFIDPLPREFGCSWEWGLVTRTEHGHLLGYKVILIGYSWGNEKVDCLIYSSETDLWSRETSHHHFPKRTRNLISLNGNLHWIDLNNDYNEVVLSIDFYASSMTGSDRCRRVTPFPDLEKTSKFTRACTPCQGFLHYMNIVDGSKLCLWRLQSEEGWELISEISAGFTLTGLDYLPLMINPLDAKTASFWSPKRQRLLYFNLLNGEYVIHKQMKGTSNGQTNIPSSPVSNPGARIYLKIPRDMYYTIEQAYLVPFVLPQWLHRIPQSTMRIKQPTTTTTAKIGNQTSLFQSERPFTTQEKGKVKAVYKEKPAKSQQKPNVNQLSSQQWFQKDIPSKNRIHGKGVTATRTDAIKLSNPFESLDDLSE